MRQIFVNLPVKDLERSKEFFSSLGEVDDLVARATATGGKPIVPQDHGFMYYRSVEDPDGHIWELLHMRSEPR
jgi:predicted lactoylglutathione lyase